MVSKRFNTSMVITLMVIASALGHAFTIGYGTGFSSRGRAMMTVQQAKHYTPSVLTIQYERHNNDIKDLLCLEIDTTYRTIGRGSFCYETICDRKISLRTSSGEHFTAEQARNCFIEGGSRRWVKQHDTKTILGYGCGLSLAVDNGLKWQAWYTGQLPHCHSNSNSNSNSRSHSNSRTRADPS